MYWSYYGHGPRCILIIVFKFTQILRLLLLEVKKEGLRILTIPHMVQEAVELQFSETKKKGNKHKFTYPLYLIPLNFSVLICKM